MDHFDFNQPAHGAYAPGRPKRRFHDADRARLKRLAAALELPPGSYEIRSNKGGNAVSGEVTLHGEWLYLHAGQSVGPGAGCGLPYQLYFRACKGRQDHGGSNCFAPLDMLNRPDELAGLIARLIGGKAPPQLPLIERMRA